MALRKPLFFNSTGGFSEEMAASDSIELGALSMSGNIDMNSNKVEALAAATTAGDAISYGQSGASLAGLSLSANLVMGSNKITGLDTPTSDQDAANKAYVDNVASGLDIKQSVRLATTAALPAVTGAGTGVGKTLTADANGALTVDSVAATAGDRVLVKDQAAGDDNGIYLVTDAGSGGAPFILTRAADFDQNAEVTAGAFTFVEEGTANADTGWVLITDNPITVDTTTLTFAQFSSATALTFDAGLIKSGASISVELDTDADAQGAGNGGGSSGLEFHAAGSGGQLRAAVHATGGLERTATGLAVKIDDTPDTLDADADGLKVVGVPSLFKINGTATGASVTAANLTTLTDGSNADSLHTHAAASEAGRVMNSLAVDEAIAIGDPVYWTSTANRVGKALANTDSKALVMGVARTAQAVQGSSADIVSQGTCQGTLSGATPGTTYWLGATGGMTTTVPSGGNRVIQVGIARSATDLWVRIIDFGKRAA